ncbi:MAG: RNA polymerase sigma factor [Phycisphaerales bacterium]
MIRSHEMKLIRRAAGGDRDAAGALIKGHQASLFAYILRLSGRPELAEDVVQEAFVRVLGNLDRFDSRFRFSTWLFTIGRRVYFNMCEKKKPSPDSEIVNSWEGEADRGRDGLERDEVRCLHRDALQAALMLLPEDQREVIVLFHQHEWPIWLIAEHLELPEGTVKSHLHRGRIRLREALESQSKSGASTPHGFQEEWR